MKLSVFNRINTAKIAQNRYVRQSTLNFKVSIYCQFEINIKTILIEFKELKFNRYAIYQKTSKKRSKAPF
jgi:hypothetical protein